LTGVLFAADVEFDFLPAAGITHGYLMFSERRGQRNTDNGHPARAVLNDERTVAVGIDVRRGGTAIVEPNDFDAARHGILMRKIEAE
jgi:hypothetical protein